MVLEEVSAWLVWVLPLIASLFVPLIGKYSDKARNYFVVAIAAVTAALALSLGARRVFRQWTSHSFNCQLDSRHRRRSLH